MKWSRKADKRKMKWKTQAERAEQRKCGSRQQKSTDLQRKHDVIEDRLKLRSLKNKTLFRHLNYHTLQPADSSSKCAPRHCWPFFAARVYCWLMFHFSPTRSCRWILAELLPSWSAPRLNNKWSHSSPYAGLCISLCWILWGSCQPFAPNFQVLTCGNTECLEWPEQTQCPGVKFLLPGRSQ